MIKKLFGFSMHKIMESGQCFRIYQHDDNYEIIAYNKYLKVQELPDNKFDFDCSSQEFDEIWFDYFDLGFDYNKIDKIIDKKDSYMIKANTFSKGIKILRQEPFEMLISFIISQRKSIPSIRKCIEAISKLSGTKLGKSDFDKREIYSFPDARSLSKLSIEELNSCMLGYRSAYIMQNSKEVANGTLNLSNIKTYGTANLISRLMQQYGVGIKVASCIALFGFHRIDVFPIDVWIKRIIDANYKGEFPPDFVENKAEYHKYAGILNQYMFFYERLKDK